MKMFHLSAEILSILFAYWYVDINLVAFNLTLMIIVQTKIVVVGLEMTGSFLDVSIVFLVGVNPAGLQKKNYNLLSYFPLKLHESRVNMNYNCFEIVDFFGKSYVISHSRCA